MKRYSVNGNLRWFAEGDQPADAVLVTAKKTVPVKVEKTEPEKKEEPVEAPKVETKAKRKPANKARKAGADK